MHDAQCNSSRPVPNVYKLLILDKFRHDLNLDSVSYPLIPLQWWADSIASQVKFILSQHSKCAKGNSERQFSHL